MPFKQLRVQGPENGDELPLGPEPFGPEFRVERLEAEGQPEPKKYYTRSIHPDFRGKHQEYIRPALARGFCDILQ